MRIGRLSSGGGCGPAIRSNLPQPTSQFLPEIKFGMAAVNFTPMNPSCRERTMPTTRSVDKEQLLAFTTHCEKCGDYAFLARCEPDAFKRDGTEIWTYECIDCGHQMQRMEEV